MADYDVSGTTARLQRIGDVKPGFDTSAASRRLDRLLDFAKRNPWFTAIVILPTLIATIYFGFVASDIYVSEARYIVRSVNNTHMNPLGMMLQSAGLAPSQDDAYSVRDFVLSRDITRRLEAEHNLRGVLSRPEGDFVTRFPPLFGGRSFEQLYETYGNFVKVTVDETTGITTLNVRAYRPSDARELAGAILTYSEELVNRLNERARHDAVDAAQREVRRNEQRVVDAQVALTQYRLRNRTLDPVKQSGAVMELAAKLSTELAASQALLAETEKAAPDSPMISSLRRRITALRGQVGTEQGKIVGHNYGAVLTISEYERLMLMRELAGKNLASAVVSLETARVEAQRKQIYLERIVQPNLPDYALYPRRLISILEILVSALLIYGIGWLVSASVREHVGR
jgi:capsular polysaccharide transport system permease protein